MTPQRTASTTASLVASALAAVALAACGSSTSAGGAAPTGSSTASSASASAASGASTAHDRADVSFAQDMIVHHRAALGMAALASTRATSADVKALAARISSEQQPEITQMTGFLHAWGEPTSAHTLHTMGAGGGDEPSGSGSASGTGSGSAPMPGMMTEQQMDDLEEATGTAFDRLFLQLMTAHHEGAVTMAKTEVADGEDTQAQALARSIISSQTAEITQMRQLLGT